MPPSSAFEPTRPAGLARLEAFLPAAARYAVERNYVRPGHGQVSRLSPWLQKRLLREEEVLQSVRARWPFAAVEKFVQEVYWRTYWKGWLEQRPDAWTRLNSAVPRLRDGLEGERRNAWEAACTGRTGIAGFDDWAQELVRTGYLHNHARMWFASIWIFTLKLPWELGADFFYRYLLDGDVASNTLSWRWVAGLQTAGKTYLARADNIAHYTDGRHEPEPHRLATAPFALQEEPLAKISAWCEQDKRDLHRGRAGLWLHPEDLSVETGELAESRFESVHAAWPADLPTATGWSPLVTRWTQAALDDGASRAARHFATEAVTGQTDDPTAAIVEWARSRELDTVVALRPFVGPWLQLGLKTEAALSQAGIGVEWRRRAWDAALFPHATRGYFPFWERIRSLG